MVLISDKKNLFTVGEYKTILVCFMENMKVICKNRLHLQSKKPNSLIRQFLFTSSEIRWVNGTMEYTRLKR